ncbi:hypothetical protein EIP91_010456 [Steccherinum ochraceum]|uniref:AB hydrolase-1 domain-containing protein n=1 Tax=Steccherinum ochraceum TaxID=92696 RepID=A0A4R0R5V7_9APHY|nr:hypothetical protein EIP91_010456 [Steccherinum ochraceum]
MSPLPLSRRGVFASHDTGPPKDTPVYTTLFILHGYSFHSDIFTRLIPLAETSRCRLVLVNRRGYPGAEPFTPQEISNLKAAGEAGRVDEVRTFCKERAREIYEFLTDFVQTEKIPKDGGIILSGWSFGIIFAMLFLLHAESFSASFDLREYIHSVVLWGKHQRLGKYSGLTVDADTPNYCIGYDPQSVPGSWAPMTDTSIPYEENMKNVFPNWVSGYFRHEDAPGGLEFRHPGSYPPPSISNIPVEYVDAAPTSTEGSDTVMSDALLASNLMDEVRRAVYFRPDIDGWNGVPVRYVWCERSTWMIVHGARRTYEECDEAKRAGKSTRPIEIVRVKEQNHFAHWDAPETIFPALLGVSKV